MAGMKITSVVSVMEAVIKGFLLLGGAMLLAGCGAVAIGGGVGTGVVASDERTAGSFVEDQAIELKVINRMPDEFNVDVVSYNRRVLLLGQVPSEDAKEQVLQIVKGVENVREIFHQYLEISGNASFASAAADTALTTKVKGALCRLQVAGFSCLDVKVVTNSSVVYLFGLVTQEQAATAVQETRSQAGVKRVVKLFEYH